MKNWIRVTKQNRCPVCGRPDWCLVSADRSAAICPRVSSSREVGEAGWLHILRHQAIKAPRPALRAAPRPAPRPMPRPLEPPPVDFEPYTSACFDAGAAARQKLAAVLGVSENALARLRAGFDAARQAWTFPMRSGATGKVIGIRLRLSDGRKLAIRGSREGLFLPEFSPAPPQAVLITEGPTDCAAALDLLPAGWSAAARPSCTGGTQHLIALVRRLRPGRVVVFGDADDAGRRGAFSLGGALRLYCPAVVVAFPPDGQKDLRSWKNAGAGWADVQKAIDNGTVVALDLKKNAAPTGDGR